MCFLEKIHCLGGGRESARTAFVRPIKTVHHYQCWLNMQLLMCRDNKSHGFRYYLERDKVGDDAVVFGGGLAGCECAIHLGMEGKKAHLVEMRDELAPDANVRHRPLLLKEIEKYAVVHTGYKGIKVTEEGILCEDKDGNEVLVPGSTVICALGQRSRSDAAKALMDAAPYVRVIGDAAKVSTITNAVYWGYHAALDI